MTGPQRHDDLQKVDDLEERPALGQVILRARLAKNLTLAQLSARVGLSISYLSALEREGSRSPSDEAIGKLAAELELDEAGLFAAAGRLTPAAAELLKREPGMGGLLDRIARSPCPAGWIADQLRALVASPPSP